MRDRTPLAQPLAGAATTRRRTEADARSSADFFFRDREGDRVSAASCPIRDTSATGRSDDGLSAQRRGGRAVREGEEPIRLGARRPRGLDVERAAGRRYDDRDAECRNAGRRRQRDGRRTIADAGAVAAVGVLAAAALMARRLVVHHPASIRTAARHHRPHAVHVAPETLGVAEAHLTQKSQEDEHAAEAEQEGRGTTHDQDAMRVGCQAKVGGTPTMKDGAPRRFIPLTVGTASPHRPRSWDYASQLVRDDGTRPQSVRRRLPEAYTPGPGQWPTCGPLSWRADTVCSASRTYTAKPVGVAEP